MSARASGERRRVLVEFYRLFYNEGRRDEAARLLTEDYLNHHGGQAARGREAAVASFGAFAKNVPAFHIEIKRLAEDGDFVWAHALITGLPDGGVAASVDIWRFEGDLIAEHWDVGQALPKGRDPALYL
jgi:predicted SnoaL-like aldol condensation-catalyzing enzyme